MDRSDRETVDLLVNSDIYLTSIQKACVSVYNLGFKPFDVNTVHRRDRMLTAVIPRSDQCSMIQRVDHTMHQYINKQKKHAQKSRYRCSMDPSKDKETFQALAQFQLEESKDNNEGDRTKSKQKDAKASKKPLKIDPRGEIKVARPTNRMQLVIEEQKKLEEEAAQREKHAKRIASRYSLIDKEGVQFVYDDNGNKVPQHVFEKQREDKKAAEERAKTLENEAKMRKHEESKAANRKITSAGRSELWAKSSSHVERLRQQAISQRKDSPYWTPGELPSSTMALATEKAALPVVHVFQKWPNAQGEYDFAVASMMPGDILVTIEHCAHCRHHEDYTHHQSAQYAEMAKCLLDALRDTSSRYALRFFGLARGIDEEDALVVSKRQARAMSATRRSGGVEKGPNTDVNDDIALEDNAISQTLGKMRRTLSLTSYNVAATDYQAVRNEAKVQVLQAHNKHRIGAFEVQVTLCVAPRHGKRPSAHYPPSSPDNINQPQQPQPTELESNNIHQQRRPFSAPATPSRSSPNHHHSAEQPRQFIQHVLYSKLFHGAWPSIVKLRTRLEVLLDFHGVTRLVVGSTRSHHHTAANGAAGAGDKGNPVLTGLLSQMQHRHQVNAQRAREQQLKLRRRSTVLPLDQQLLGMELDLSKRKAAAAEEERRQQEQRKRLEDFLPPAFDHRNGLPPSAIATSIMNSRIGTPSLDDAGNHHPVETSNGQSHNTSPPYNFSHIQAHSHHHTHAHEEETLLKTLPLYSNSSPDKQRQRQYLDSLDDYHSVQSAGPTTKSSALVSHPSLFNVDINTDHDDDELAQTNQLSPHTAGSAQQQHSHGHAKTSKDTQSQQSQPQPPVDGKGYQKVASKSLLVQVQHNGGGGEGEGIDTPVSVLTHDDRAFLPLRSPSPVHTTSAGGNLRQASFFPDSAINTGPNVTESSTKAGSNSSNDKPSAKKKDRTVPAAPRPTVILAPPVARPTHQHTSYDEKPHNNSSSSLDSPPPPSSSAAGGANGKTETETEAFDINAPLATVQGDQVSLSDHFKHHESDLLKQALQSIQEMLGKDDDNHARNPEDADYDYYNYDDDGRNGGLRRMDTYDDPFWRQLESGESIRMSISFARKDDDDGGDGGGHLVELSPLPLKN